MSFVGPYCQVQETSCLWCPSNRMPLHLQGNSGSYGTYIHALIKNNNYQAEGTLHLDRHPSTVGGPPYAPRA